VAVAVEQMCCSIQEISKGTSEAARVASAAAGEVEVSCEAVRHLGDSSSEIGNVVKVISAIAQQTNLLALNATIEAARAGEAGKGFAVVANEVKELARETATATKDITEKIAAIQTGTGAAVTAIERISRTIQQIKDISNTIASAVDQQLATTGEIGRSLGEAAKGSSEISSGVLNVAEAAKDTAKASSSTLRSAEALGQMAVELRHLTEQFRAVGVREPEAAAAAVAGPPRVHGPAERRDLRAIARAIPRNAAGREAAMAALAAVAREHPDDAVADERQQRRPKAA
jgi:methyl-accepting chemotaxis protein